MIPKKFSRLWIIVFFIYTFLVFLSLLLTRVILDSDTFGGYLFTLIFIAVASSLFPCIGGYFGKRIYFLISTVAVILGVLYMFYVVIGNVSPGWGDLTSIIGYLYIIGIGAILGFITEVVLYFIKR
ncbi:MAG: putative rane protein [Herbinix sp.]|nr:putative rane protein [Herbinix sp.]